MFNRCPRCALTYGAPSPGAICPRCGAHGVEAPTHAHAPVPAPTLAVPIAPALPATQEAPVFAAETRVAPTRVGPPAHVAHPTQPWTGAGPGYRSGPASTEDRGAIAGRAAAAAALSTLAVVGCCNPLGWVGLVLAIRAYASTGDADLGPAESRARTARAVALVAFGSTALVWAAGVGSWYFS